MLMVFDPTHSRPVRSMVGPTDRRSYHSVLSPEGENQVDDRKEQSASHRTVSRCSALSPKLTELEDVEGQSKKAMELTKGRIAEWIDDPNLLHRMHALILFTGVAGLNSRSWIESRHVGSFGELGRARQTTQRCTEVPHLTFYFLLYLKFDFVTFSEKLEVAESTRLLAKSLLDRPLSAPLKPLCTIAFGWQILACRMLSVIHFKGLPIADMQKISGICLSNPFGEPDLPCQNMVRTNINMPPWKRAQGNTINEGGSNPPKRERQERTTGGQSRGKRPTYERETTEFEDTLSELEDDQLSQSQPDEIWARSHPDFARVPSSSTPAGSVSAPAHPLAPVPLVIPPPS
uniref:Integrase core domain containing protein n=1 Tax=Solanum tuberosum TaxID=4113 RepID=M1DGX0_SOLTU